MKQKKKRWVIPVILVCIAAAFVLFAVNMKITDVTVVGSEHYTNEEVIQMVFKTPEDWNPFYAFLSERFKEHRDIPFIEKYKVSITGLHSAKITVYEKSLAGCMEYMGTYLYFDKDGIVVESSGERIPQVPLITGIQFDNIVMYEPLTVEDPAIFGEILNLSQILSGYDMEVDRIYYESASNIELYTGNLRVILGSSEFMAEKIGEFNDMLPKIKDLSGTLYLNEYDPASKNPSYPFVAGS